MFNIEILKNLTSYYVFLNFDSEYKEMFKPLVKDLSLYRKHKTW